MKKFVKNVILSAVGTLSVAASVQAATVSGSHNGMHWQARNNVVGQTSTATLAGGGDPRYFAPMPQYSGVAALIMNYAAGSFICSGTLLPDRRSVLTAAHCVNPDASTGPLLSTTAYFYGGPNPDTVVPTSPSSTAVAVSNVFMHPSYTGQVVDHNDIAVLRLGTAAPAFAADYGLSAETDLTGDGFNIAGYGARSTAGGSVGANLGAGRLRQGDNRYEARLGDADFAGGWELIFGQPTSEIGFSYLSDFDNGLAANDTMCEVAADPFFALGGPKYCNLGVGADEVSTAGGDSGGPQFGADGKITSVTSYGLTFGSVLGDVDDFLNSSWGEFNGFVPVHIHLDFINRLLVPAAVSAPGSLLLALAGIALLSRRRRQAL